KASVHRGIVFRGAPKPPRRAARGDHSLGRGAKPAQSALGLPFPPALPACNAALRRGGAAVDGCRRPPRRLPPLRPRREPRAHQDSRRGFDGIMSMLRREVITLIGGAAAAWPLTGRAQQKARPVIGWLSSGSPQSDEILARLAAFRQGLKETGYIEGQNVAIEYRWAEGQYDRFPALAADLIRLQATVIVTPGPSQAFAAKAATSTIPIVFNLGMDPVQSGLVASLNRPGGNITGVSLLNAELAGKRLDLLHQLLPTAAVVALLVNPTNPSNYEQETRGVADVARSIGLQSHVLRASTPSEIDAAFGALVDLRAAALVVAGDRLFTTQQSQIVALAARHAVPAIYIYREFAEAGGLMSYGADLADSYRQVGVLTGKILNGAKPADLPVQQVVKLELVINLKTAKTLGLTIPQALLGRADEIIE